MSGEKTEKATPKRRQDLRKKGVVARSMELPSAVSMLALAMILPGALRQLWNAMSNAMQIALTASGTADTGVASAVARQVLRESFSAAVPMVAVVGISSALAAIVVTRSRPNLHVLKPKFDRVSPKSGLKRLFSLQPAVEVLKTVAKLAVLTLIAWRIGSGAVRSMALPHSSLGGTLAAIAEPARAMFLYVAGVALLIGVFDAWWQRRRFNKQARMSKQDVKEEHKAAEGNPASKGAIRAAQRRLSRNRMIAAVAAADVVLANPTHVAVALKYTPGSPAPVVVAKGAGVIAARIKQEAATHDVPIIENKPLARALWRGTEVGDVIPADFYRAVAEVLAAVYTAKRRRRLAA